MNMNEIAPNKLTSDLLFANGVSDAKRGVHYSTGWREVANELGFSSGRTPARERYEDGWYSVPANERPEVSA